MITAHSIGRRAGRFAATALFLMASVLRAQSLPEIVTRHDADIKALQKSLAELTQKVGAPSSTASGDSFGVVLQKGELRQSQYGLTQDEREQALHEPYGEIVRALDANCVFAAVGLRIDGKAQEFGYVVNARFPVSSAALSSAEFEGVVSCDERALLSSLYSTLAAGVALPATRAASRPDGDRVKVRCDGGLVINTRTADSGEVHWVVPVISPTIASKRFESIAAGQWGCSARLVSDSALKPSPAAFTGKHP